MGQNKRFFREGIFITAFFTAAVWILAAAWPAAAGDLGFDDKIGYDIYYYSGGDNVSLIKNVEILRVQSVHNIDFLVVQGAGFKVENEEGFILLNTVRAILPHSFYRVTRPIE